MNLESTLRAKRDAGKKLLVPYVTGGLGAAWLDVVRAVALAGADAIEIGIPFSDPVMDGRTIQEASQRALDLGATPAEHRGRARERRRRRPARRDDVLQPGAAHGSRAVRRRARRGRRRRRDRPRPPARRAQRLGRRGGRGGDRDRAARRADDRRRAARADLRAHAAASSTASRSWASRGSATTSRARPR